jgi:hypothetical protein
MDIVDYTGERIVVEDTVKRSGYGFIALLALCAFLLVVAIWSDGFIPGTMPYRYIQEGAPRHIWFTVSCVCLTLVVLVAMLLRSYSRLIFDRPQGYLSILKVRWTGESLVRREPLRAVREVKVDSQGDIWRFEIELQSGEKLIPRRSYNNYYPEQKLQSVVEQINEFLAGY